MIGSSNQINSDICGGENRVRTYILEYRNIGKILLSFDIVLFNVLFELGVKLLGVGNICKKWAAKTRQPIGSLDNGYQRRHTIRQ